MQNFYSLQNSAFSVTPAYLIFDSISLGESLFSINQAGAITMEGIKVKNAEIKASTSATVASLFKTSAGYASFTDFEIMSLASLDQCQIIYTTDSISLTNVLIEGVDFSSQGLCEVPPIQLKGGQSFFNNVRVLNFNNLGYLRNGGALALSNAKLTDSNSIYRNNSAAQGGALYLDQNAQYISIDCSYELNTAQAGGVFSLKKNAKLVITGASAQYNYASQKGGLLWMIAASQISILNSTISHNSAFREALISAQLTDLTVQSAVQNSVLFNNTAARELVMSLYSANFKLLNVTYIDNYGSTMFAGIRIEGSNLTISSSQFAYSQVQIKSRQSFFQQCYSSRPVIQSGFVLSQYSSFLNVYNSSFIRGCAKTGGAIMISGSTQFTISNCIFSHNRATDNGGALFLSLHQKGNITNSTFQNNTALQGADLYIEQPYLSERVIIHNSTFTGGQDYQSLWIGEASLMINSSFFTGTNFQSSTPSTTLIKCLDCMNFQLINSRFFSFKYSLSILQISTLSSMSILNNNFTQIEGHQSGGVLHISKTHQTVIERNQFVSANLSGGQGGAIYITSSQAQGITIRNNKFEACVAFNGGAIAFDYYKPTLINNQFINNSALSYGPNIASYPVTLMLVASTGRLLSSAQLDGIQSGGVLNSFQLGLIDADGYLYPLDSSSVVTPIIHSSQSTHYTANIQGTTEFRAQEGIFNISGVAVVSEPGTAVSVKFKTNAINPLLPLVDQTQVLWDSFELQIKLRKCIVGEELLQNGECKQCIEGTFLLEVPQSPQNCQPCPSNAVCFGGNLVTPAPGYWRQDAKSLLFFQCFNPGACQGSSFSDYNALGHCHPNYQGILCAQCKPGFSRNSFFECEICPDLWKNLLLILLILFVAALFLIFLIRITLASSTSPRSVLSVFIKIMFSHLQMLSLVGALELNWPSEVSSFIQKSSIVTEAIKSIISLDCLVGNFVLIKRFYVYLITFFCLPFFLMGVTYLFWFCFSKAPPQVKSNKSTASILTILFLIHPLITSVIFQAFYCRNVNHKYRLVEQLSEICWSSSHLQYALPFGGLGLIIWVIGVPLGSYLLLLESKDALATFNTRQKYGFLYNGYKRNAFFWQSIVMLRKASVSFIAVFLRTYGVVIQALCTELLLIVSIFMTLRVKPYEHKILNSMQVISLACLSVTVYCGIYYLSAKLETDDSFIYGRDYVLTNSGKWFFFVVIMASNVVFLVAWLRNLADAFIQTLVEKKPKVYTIFCLCCQRRKLLALVNRMKRKNIFKERISEIDQIRQYLRQGQAFYEQGDAFTESAKFDRVLQESKFKLKRIRFEPALKIDYKIHRHHSNSSGLPENFDSNLAIAELSTFSEATQPQTIEFVEPEEQRKSRLMPRKSKKSLKSALEKEPVKQIKRMRETKQENDQDQEEVDLELEGHNQNEPYVEVVAQRIYQAPQEKEEIKPTYHMRQSLRPPMSISTRRKSAITRDDFQLKISTTQDQDSQDYNLEFVCLTPPHGQQSKDWKRKASLRKSLRVSPFSYLTRDETPQKPYLESFHQHVTPQLFESDINYDLDFSAEK